MSIRHRIFGTLYHHDSPAQRRQPHSIGTSLPSTVDLNIGGSLEEKASTDDNGKKMSLTGQMGFSDHWGKSSQ